MKSNCSLLLLCICLTACAPAIVTDPEATDELLSGYLLFGEPVDVADIKSDNILAVNDAMRAYVEARVGKDPQARSRMQKLISSMIDDELLTMDYDPNLTFTAAEAFSNRQGNCLSFSLLFAALAREADLDLTFQMVDIPPSFRADGELILLNNHINVRVRGVRRDINFAGDYVVDFNSAEFNGNYDTTRVDDSYAIALYYSNIAVEAMQAGDTLNAFRFLKKGIMTDARIPGLWVNLGVLYSRARQPEKAVTAYRQALSLQRSNKSALVNLATVLQQLGRGDEADYYSGQVSYYRNRHPYYYYYLAQTAYQQKRSTEALRHLGQAIKLKDDEHQFYFLRGLVHEQQGELGLAASDYQTARDVAEKAQLVSGYDRKLKALQDRLR